MRKPGAERLQEPDQWSINNTHLTALTTCLYFITRLLDDSGIVTEIVAAKLE